jgi:mannose-6-phosphate isomerase-like protein (cupin superfamily)
MIVSAPRSQADATSSRDASVACPCRGPDETTDWPISTRPHGRALESGCANESRLERTVEDEAIFVLDGEVQFKLGDKIHTGAAGSYVLIPRGTPHA